MSNQYDKCVICNNDIKSVTDVIYNWKCDHKIYKDCFKNIIEVEINSFLKDKVFPVDTSEFILTLKIDTIGKFSLDKFTPSEKLNSVSIDMIKNAVENIPNALPAIKTNVGEFVEVTFNLPFKFNYE